MSIFEVTTMEGYKKAIVADSFIETRDLFYKIWPDFIIDYVVFLREGYYD